MTVTIRADVDAAKRTVLLISDQAGLDPGDTFKLGHEETVRWKVSGVPSGLRMQVKLEGFLGREDGSKQLGQLFKEAPKDTLPADAAAIVGTVDPKAAPGHYSYGVALVGGPQPIPLRCLWAPGPGQPPQEVEPPRGGGVQTKPPPR